MADLGAVAGHPLDTRRQRSHRLERCVVRHRGRWKCPHVAERHRSEAPGGLAVSCGDAAANVQQRGAVDNPAAELIRRAVHVIFVAMNNFGDTDIGGFQYASAMRALTNAKSRSAAASMFFCSAAGVAPVTSYSTWSDTGP